MFTVTLEPHYEKVWSGKDSLLDPFLAQHQLLYHQWLTYNAEKPLIVNTYNTGTGKTKAALLRLLKRAATVGFHRLNSSEHNALLIAPTNELLAQHKRDAEAFCATCNLPYRVVAISRADLDVYQAQQGFSEETLRSGAALHYILQNARRVDATSGKRATLFIVNPDIFYYMLYCCYHRFDRLPLFQDVLNLFYYIVIDEFHYYNPKQFANFLFFMALSKHYGFVDRQYCLLTATPSEVVKEYLKRLAIPTEWIEPENESSEGEEVCALAPTMLTLYSIQELQDGLSTLVQDKKAAIRAWLNAGDDGACISGALWRINHIYTQLRTTLPSTDMGRLTGAQRRKWRVEAQSKRLILATPTVDIGYNFERCEKTRQIIDFLLFDAYSSDEFIQRLGRAGRVLGKQQCTLPSHAFGVVNQELYAALQMYADQTIKRHLLRQMAEKHLPTRHILYSYIQSGAIAEAFLPIYRLEGMAADEEKPDIEALFEEVRSLFAPDARITYDTLRRCTRRYITQSEQYGRLEHIPTEMTDCIKACEKRVMYEQERRKQGKGKLWSSKLEVYQWLQGDLREYFVEKARFSFREAFQAPLALVYDEHSLLSDETVCCYDALHIAKNYRAKYYTTLQEWQSHVTSPIPHEASNAMVFCDLVEQLEPDARLHLGLKLFVGDCKKAEWEEQFVYRSSAYKPTALYGLEVIASNSSRGLAEAVRTMFQKRYIPAIVATEGGRTAAEMWRLQRSGQLFPYELQVEFADLKRARYYVVLGTMALLVWAEVLPYYRKMDERKGQKNNDEPMIC